MGFNVHGVITHTYLGSIAWLAHKANPADQYSRHFSALLDKVVRRPDLPALTICGLTDRACRHLEHLTRRSYKDRLIYIEGKPYRLEIMRIRLPQPICVNGRLLPYAITINKAEVVRTAVSRPAHAMAQEVALE